LDRNTGMSFDKIAAVLEAEGIPAPSGGKKWHTSTVRRIYASATYASLCLAAGIRPIDIAELMGHRDVKTTLTVYAHLINTDDHTGNMAALGALSAPAATPTYGGNVIRIRG
jgi:integrase